MNEEITQEIKVRAAPQDVFNELLSWGESRWWPENSLMTFVNLSKSIDENTLYLQKVNVVFGPSWHTRNHGVDRRGLALSRIFLDGMFEGYEDLRAIPGEDENKELTLVRYAFSYRVKGAVNQWLWNAVFKKMHMQNLDRILNALKEYLESR